MVKTIAHSETLELRRTLSSYFEHLKTNPHTLITRVLGFHRVQMYVHVFMWF